MSLKEKGYKTLRKDILTGKIPGGTHTTESSIAKQLDVSRTPVREALQRLAQEKLIKPLPRAGYIIEDMSYDDIKDLFSARFDIESLVIGKAVQYITDSELETLKKSLVNQKKCISDNDFRTMTDLDVEFHSIIYKASRSKTFYRICKNLSDLTIKYRHGLNTGTDVWNESIQNHATIYEALFERDQKKAVTAISDHAKQVKSQLLGILKKVRSDSFYQSEA